MRGGSGVFSELGFFETADFTALGTFTSEASLLGGQNRQGVVPRNYFDRVGAAVLIEAEGIVSSTGTPTFLFTNRLGTVLGSADLTGAAVGVSAAIVTGSGISNAYWYLRLLLSCRTPGQGAGNTTLNCAGFVQSGGFAAPYTYALHPTTPPTATWTQTVNNAVELYPNLSATCSASDAANAIRCKRYNVHFFT
jgi:hypothetical protein